MSDFRATDFIDRWELPLDKGWRSLGRVIVRRSLLLVASVLVAAFVVVAIYEPIINLVAVLLIPFVVGLVRIVRVYLPLTAMVRAANDQQVSRATARALAHLMGGRAAGVPRHVAHIPSSLSSLALFEGGDSLVAAVTCSAYFREEGRPDIGAALLEKALASGHSTTSSDPTTNIGLVTLGSCYHDLARFELAIDVLRPVVRTIRRADPTNAYQVSACSMLAACYSHLGREEEALAVLAAAMGRPVDSLGQTNE